MDPKEFEELCENARKLTEQMRAIQQVADEEHRELSVQEARAFEDLGNRVEALNQRIDRENRLRALEESQRQPHSQAERPNPEGSEERRQPGQPSRFRSLGEQLRAVVRAATHGMVDQRLTMRAYSGANETIGSEGGFLVQTDFANELFTRAYELAQVASRARKMQLGAAFNTVKIPAVSETSRADGSRWGGVLAYWVGEGDSYTATKPKFRYVEISMKKLVSLCYATDELLADASMLEQVVTQAFSEETAFKLDDGMINGNGSGQPQGILNCPALVTVAKEGAQAATTVVANNILKMYSRMWASSRKNSVWFINQDVEPQLFGLTLGTATVNQAVYIPPGGLSGAPFATLMGRPVVPIEQCSTLGTVGDIIFADMSQYALIDKGPMQAAASMHVAFLTDEQVFRFTYRVDGQPLWQSALTPFKGSNTLSPFIALQAR